MTLGSIASNSLWWAWLMGLLASTSICWAWQPPDTLPAGFNKLETSRHLTLITDLPIDDEIRSIPTAFDQALPVWCRYFSMDQASVTDWQVTLYLMLDRNRFKQAGLIPEEVPEFPYGWQYGDKLWVMEQPSPYYRRHLALHEGTHWFMYRKYGFYDTPWLAEGIAEVLATHRCQDDRLTMGIVPANREEVPYWGRIKIVQEQCANELAPSLEDILRYNNTAHQNVDAYAWSWAMVLFLQHHPDASQVFEVLLKQPAMTSREVERWLRTRLAAKLPRLRSEWDAFITELDYGYSPEPGMLQLADRTSQISSPRELEFAASAGWQSSGIEVQADQPLKIEVTGGYTVAQTPKPWRCTPAGVTLEYYRGQPLGKVMMAILAPRADERPTELIEWMPVGERLEINAPHSGQLFFRVNEATGELMDNTGSFSVSISSK